MNIHTAIEDYRFATLHLSPKTREWYDHKLKVFDDWSSEKGLSLENITTKQLRLYAEFISHKLSPRGKPLSTYTQHGYLQSLKAFLSWCSKEEDIEDVVSANLYRRVPMNKVEEKVIEVFTGRQVLAMLEATKNEYNMELTTRDRAIVSVLVDTGIRASELLSLTVDNCFLGDGREEGAFLRVHGKGNKWRDVPLGNTSLAALRKYITRHRPKMRDKTVFLNRYHTPMTQDGLSKLINRLAEWGHVKGVRTSPHTFRHTFATNFLLNGGDIYKLKLLMGHTSVTITEGYLKTTAAHQVRDTISVLDTLK